MNNFNNFIRCGSLNSTYYSIHPHILKLTFRKMWECNAGCGRQFFSANSYYCEMCDFDCCLDCFYKYKDMTLNGCSPIFLPSIHNHPLKLQNSDYYCNAGCGEIFTKTNSFCCSMCDFDCCPNCLMKYGFQRSN